MNPVIVTALVTLGLISALAFGLGLVLGRYGERRAVADWLNAMPRGDRPAGWVWGNAVERGAHRRKQRSEIVD